VKTGTNPVFDISIRNRDTNYGIAYRGFISIPTDGIYTFYISSDDGSKLSFGNQVLINNDGLHGMGELSQKIGLKAGLHAINIDFFQNAGGQGLQVSYSGPGIAKQVIPASVLYRQIFSNNPPTITLTSDKASGIAPASFTLTATATDSDGTIAKVEFYNGTTLLTTDNASPYTYNWTNVGVGTYAITAKAYDDNNAVTTSSAITITVAANQAPTVSITAPANNATYLAPASFTISATASDADGSIAKVEFYNGATLLGTATTTPYNYSWTNVAVGTYTITAKAYDNLGLTTISSAITVKVNANQAPTVSITAPANNAIYVAQANIALTATAADADGSVAKVEFYNGATLLGQSTTSPYTYSWTNVGAGTYTITAKAYDNLGASTTSSAITIQVNGNQNPTVSITSPANNATFISPATITINATASDIDGTVSKVDFYNGTTLLGTDNSSPYSYTWSGVAAGTYTITAKATDDKNGTTTSSAITVVVNNPNVAPTVSITSPANNASFVAPSDITITTNASDSDGSISKVEFYNGATLLGTVTSGPYNYVWSGVTAGTYTITAKAYDNQNTSTTSSAITVKLNVDQNPTISITATSNNPNSVSISVNASDPDGTVSKVEYYDGTTKIGESTSSPFTFTWSNVPAGSHTITAVAIDDKGGKTTSNPITVTVVNPNQSPTVSITSPVNNSGYTEPATITIQANASDPDGTIQKVEFYNGTIKLGESTSSPYGYTWSGVIAGTYTITAKAYDNQNAITTSAPVTVIVNANQAPTVSITSPADQDKFNENATITITAAANDPDGSIQKVEFYFGATYLGDATSAPYSITWQNVPAGTYTLTAKAYDNLNEVTTSTGVTIYVQTVSGIDDSLSLKNAIKVYPNPVYTDLNIEFSVINRGAVSMKLYDVKGNVVKVIKEDNFDQGHFTLHDDLSALPDGVYLLRTFIGNQVFTTEVFKGSKPKNSGKFQSKK
jgi:chitodextrinase